MYSRIKVKKPIPFRIPAVSVAMCYFCLSAIVTARELDFCVRDVYRYFLSAMMTTSGFISPPVSENHTRYFFPFPVFRKAAGLTSLSIKSSTD